MKSARILAQGARQIVKDASEFRDVTCGTIASIYQVRDDSV